MNKSGSLFVLVVVFALAFVVGVFALERYRAHCRSESSGIVCFLTEISK